MTDSTKWSERRAHRRYKVKTQAFAALASQCLIGQIGDISKVGISFTCIAGLKSDSKVCEIEIFTADDKFHLRGMAFKIISEKDVEDRIPSSSLQKKQITGVFLDPTASQSAQLAYFLDHYIVAED